MEIFDKKCRKMEGNLYYTVKKSNILFSRRMENNSIYKEKYGCYYVSSLAG